MEENKLHRLEAGGWRVGTAEEFLELTPQEAAFVELIEHPETAGVPFILETPDSRGADNRDIPLLKKLRG